MKVDRYVTRYTNIHVKGEFVGHVGTLRKISLMWDIPLLYVKNCY